MVVRPERLTLGQSCFSEKTMSTDEEWEKWGQTNPYYGVLSDDKFRGGNLSDILLQDFFKSGEEYIAAVYKAVSELQHGFSPKRALDFGCGVGRLLIPLAERCEQVVGVDISPSMLEEARKHVSRFNGRVLLVRSDDELSKVQGSFDLIHSVIVFQHIPKARGLKIVSALLSRLNQGGVAVLHFQFSRNASLISKVLHLVRRILPGVHPVLNVVRGRPFRDPIMEMNCYEIDNLLTTFSRHGIEGVHVKLHPEHTGYRTATLIGAKRVQG